jgi:hypothetical protein
MPNSRNYQLVEKEILAVDKAIRRDKQPEIWQRCSAICLLNQGYKLAQVAEIQSVSILTIYTWLNRWREGGVEELATKACSAKVPKTDEAYRHLLMEKIYLFARAISFLKTYDGSLDLHLVPRT